MGDTPLWLQQLVYQLPGLLVYTLGLLLALVYWRRCHGPALLTVIGCGLLFLTAVGHTAVYVVLVEQRQAGEIPHEQFARVMSLLGLVSSGTRAVGLALVVIAVFVGRGGSRHPDADE